GSDTSEGANPFTDGLTGNIGPTEEFMYKVGGEQFSVFADSSLMDDDSGNSYVEMQALWISGDNHFDSDPDDVVGKLDFLAYTLKFDGPGGDELGIPECTEAEDQDYAACKDDVGETTIDDATETHRVKVWFLGEEWIISEMNAPTDSDVTTETEVRAGGSVKLAKEAVAGILNQGESLPVDGMKFQLDDLEAHGNTVSAIISVLDANGNILKKDKVNPGQTKEMTINGKAYRFHVYKVAPGYTFGAKWADVAIFAKELELVDGQELNQDENNNEGYEVALGWKNLDAATGVPADGDPERPDALRTVVIYSDSVEDITSTGDDILEEGDYVSIVKDPEVWKLSYKGLDLTSEDRKSLKFEIKTTDKEISASKGPLTSCSDGSSPTGQFPTTCAGLASPEPATCTIYAPYIQVTSGDSGSVFDVDRSDSGGTLSDNEFLVSLCVDDGVNDACAPGILSAPFESVACDANNDGDPDDDGITPYFGPPPAGADFGLAIGTVFMRISQSSNDYGFWESNDPSDPTAAVGLTSIVRYPDIADGDDGFESPEGGVIVFEFAREVDGGGDGLIGDMLTSGGASCGGFVCGDSGPPIPGNNIPDWYFAIAEKAGTGSSNEFVNYWVFGLDGTGSSTPGDATFDFASDDGSGFTLTSDDAEIRYGHALANDAAAGFYGGPITSGPVTEDMEMVEEGYISERGSVFKTIDEDTVQFDMAHKLAKAQWFLAAASSSAADASKTIATLGEGESTTVSGVTVKVLEITEDVGACSAGTGSVSCTADMSGVSAVIMPNNAASVAVATPTAYANLVVLDSDAVGVNTIVSVGGDKVNTVSKDLLSAAPVDWASEKKVVREVVAGSKIVVAGAEAADTLAAAQDFVSQVKKV
ncbi:MAG: hypothetical protein V1861_02835, partial [Candidatus Micrarchaeota archaeon]